MSSRPRPARRAAGRALRLQLEILEDRTVPTLLGNTLFPADNPWNQPITNAPVAANSNAVLSSIISQYGDGQLHPDFGQDYFAAQPLYGIPYNVVHGNTTPKIHVVIDSYASESDVQDAPIPANAVLEGDNQNGPASIAQRGDSHLIVYDVDNNVGYEFFSASRPSENTDGRWHAAQETVWNYNTDTFRTLGWTSADAAGLPILPGLIRPDEGLPAAQGGQGVINHAIRMTLQNSVILDQFLYPASHAANPGNTDAAVQPPMGARFRLKASVDISGLSPQARVIAQAMKDYGLIVADNGSNFFISGASYAATANNTPGLTWDDNDIQDSVSGLKSLHFSDFELVDLTPVVTGLSATRGPAGTAVTITGENFSGAAGHLQVLFGSTPATAVSVVDDGHITATAPAGAGTVDVRVQSGVSAPGLAGANYTDPVFGYGVSATSAADQFTYDTPGFTYDPATQTLTINGTNFGFVQKMTTDATGTYLADTFTIDGTSEVFPESRLARVVVLGSGGGSAWLTTGASSAGDSIFLGNRGGTVARLNAAGNAANYVYLSGFAAVYSLAGPLDPVLMVGTSGVANTFVSAGRYSYLTSGSAFYYVSGSKYVYAYAAGAGDVAYHYDGSGPSTYVASGMAYSAMSGTDQGRPFFNEAVGFRFNHGVATHAGQDVAYFYDSPLSDVFIGFSAYSYLYAANPNGSIALYDDASNFAAVYAYSFVGGIDYAFIYDTMHDHEMGFVRLV